MVWIVTQVYKAKETRRGSPPRGAVGRLSDKAHPFYREKDIGP